MIRTPTPKATAAMVAGVPDVGAIISGCGAYRYTLSRVGGGRFEDGEGTVMFIGVNPSTADADTDDQTVRKWCHFARRWEYHVVEVGNLFAYRATDVRHLAKVDDPVGRDNDHFLVEMMARADLVVPCWGSRNKLPARARNRIHHVRGLLRASGRPVKVLGLTASGDPRHPLFLGYDTPLEGWNP
jgi:hypothetical protein